MITAATQHYVDLLKAIALEGGRLACEMRATASVAEKADRSLVTAADLAVTALVKDRLQDILAQPNHILIDEESVVDLPPVAAALATDYQWVLDPIDGTAPYSAGLPFWGVSLGLMRKGEPWLGAVYLPDVDELFFTDSEKVYVQRNVSSNVSEIDILQKKEAPVFERSPYMTETRYPFDVAGGYARGYPIRTGAVVSGAMRFLDSNVAGFMGKAYIWDQAAVFAMAKALKLEIVHCQQEKDLGRFSIENLNDNWSLKQPFIIAKKENMPFMRSRLVRK